jgi:carnitine 3-dehydrogenase
MDIERVACVGVGLIGHSWVTLFSLKGFSVAIYDVTEDILAKALSRVEANLRFLAEKKFIEQEDVESALGRIKTTSNISEAVAEADYVQESTFERYEEKKTVFKEMDSAAPAQTILASSSSGLLMTEIQRATEKPERCLVAHPWNPPHLIPLVELVPGERTSQEAVKATYDFMVKVGKVPIVLRKEVPGHIANRLQAAVWREAIALVDRGVASVEDVDKALYAGPGIRWAFMGSNMTLHLGGGPGGLEYFIEHLGPAFSVWWSDMDTWTSISPTRARKVVEGLKQVDFVQRRTMAELVEWRDERLVELLKILYK